ncbi:PC-Esterase protein [Dioscorea alata]|uniref:PC-Esterase protein n=1 Tax=Dioscorea alata TaxID=55571 RepID=A0ACB7USQ9_DIOAL|nr:PC-Esterase protein [Dioscorea alata]
MMIGNLSRSSSARLSNRTSGLNSPRHSFSVSSFSHRKWIPFSAAAPSLISIAGTFFLSALLLAFACALYLYLLRGTFFTGFAVPEEKCDVFSGSWVPDTTYPLYNSSDCPFVERGFNCLANGREDTGYLKWRWKPSTCDSPRFDAREALERLRGKRVVFVGDSMSRTQWESMICMLMTGVDDKNSVHEVNGNSISKTIRFLGVRFEGYNLSVEFFRSVFLVQLGFPPKHGPKRVKTTLKLDRLDDISHRWVDSDILIFNSGHWWAPSKLFDLGCYFQAGGLLKLGMPITSAFKIALETWAFWVETMVNTNRTHVFFRTFEPSHWSSNKKVCDMTQQPSSEAKGDDRSEFGEILAEVVGKMRVSVNVLNVTLMGAFRSDAHIGPWTHPSSVFDCSHWCLPGVPDAWNELVFSYLLANAK